MSRVKGTRMRKVTAFRNKAHLALAGLATMLLAGCISIGGKTPDILLSLSPDRVATMAGTETRDPADAIVVYQPSAVSDLQFLRVPVRVNPAQIAYLKDLAWVERPSRQFQKLLAETLRGKTSRMVSEAGVVDEPGRTEINGRLLDMGYDAASQSVVVRFEAEMGEGDGPIRTRRFEASVPGVEAKADAVAPAINSAANDVAGQVADWIVAGGK
jgi:cholesterol transport system auxiliary component